MTAIRVVVQGNYADADQRIQAMLEYSQSSRNEAGCLQAEDFRGTEFAEDILHLELWESLAAFDAHWQKWCDSPVWADFKTWQAPHHYGKPEASRRQGQNGVEIYRQVRYGRAGTVWAPADEAERSSAVRFPAWGPVRIVIQGTSPADADMSAQVDNAQETRLEPGCLQFENFRGVEYPENTCLMELWSSPEIYDIHWLNRLVQQAGRTPGPRPAVERRYGTPGLEWYAHSYFTLVDNVWQPEDPARRMVTVHW